MKRGILLLTLLLVAPVARAQSALEEIDVVEHLGRELPRTLAFNDQNGRVVRLEELFRDGKPVVLTLQYFRCPMLCSLVLNGLVKGLQPLGLHLDRDYHLATVSFDPDDRPDVARAKRARY